jgi:hypothetical protein
MSAAELLHFFADSDLISNFDLARASLLLPASRK